MEKRRLKIIFTDKMVGFCGSYDMPYSPLKASFGYYSRFAKKIKLGIANIEGIEASRIKTNVKFY